MGLVCENLHEWLIFFMVNVNVGKYNIHGSYGVYTLQKGYHISFLKSPGDFLCKDLRVLSFYSKTLVRFPRKNESLGSSKSSTKIEQLVKYFVGN